MEPVVLDEVVVCPAVVEQGVPAGNAGVESFADQDAMVSRVQTALHPALQDSECPVKQRGSSFARCPDYVLEALTRGFGEAAGKIPLFGAEDVHCEKLRFVEGRQLTGGVGDGRHHQRRFQRQRYKRINREAEGGPIGSAGGENGNACRETAAGLPEIGR